MDADEWEYVPIAPKATLHFVAMKEEAHKALVARIAALEAALRTIVQWKDFPPTDDGLSYGYHWGSNGERDHMRGIARAALEKVG